MLLHEHIVLLLLNHEVLFLLFEFLLQEVDQVIAATSELCIKCASKHWICGTVVARFAHTSRSRRESTSHIVTRRLCIFRCSFSKLLLQTLDDFLTEVGTLGQLFLNLFVDLNLTLVGLNLLLHLVVLEDQNLSLL